MPELTRRFLTAGLLAPLVLAAIWLGGMWFLALLALLGLALAWEWSQLFGEQLSSERAPPLLASLHVAALLGVCVFLGFNMMFHPHSLIIIALACGGSFVIAWMSGQQKWLAGFGPVYLIAPLVLLADLRADSSYGAAAVIVFVLMVWASDSGAYFTGRFIGGPLLLPKISAQKTWSGALGGVTASMLLGYAAGFFFGGGLMLLLWGGLISVATQSGDFLESFIKRRHDLKDMGSLLPGHGGFLDRMDGLLIAIVVFYIAVFLQGWPDMSAAAIFLKAQ